MDPEDNNDQPDQQQMEDQMEDQNPHMEDQQMDQMDDLQPDENQQYGIDPNQQINPDFLGGQMPPEGQYGEEMDPDGDYAGNGMFNGNRDIDEDGQQDEQDEYFDDAGDIGYLPADHVSFNLFLPFSFSP